MWFPVLFLLLTVASDLARSADAGDLRQRDDAHTKSHFTGPGYVTLEDWQTRRAELRRQILASAGLWPLTTRTAPATRTFGPLTTTGDGYTVTRLAFESLPGFWIGANLYLPTARPSPGSKLPAVLVPHGHWKHGRVEHNTKYSVPALCANLAAQGYAVLAYDMVGYNDTLQLPHRFGDSDEERAWMFHPLGVQLWNSLRAMDLLSAHPLIDASRIAVTGASGGGTQTFLLAAVDDRVRVSMPAAMISATFQGNDACEVAPGLRIGANNMEFAAMAAPRPQLLLAASGDWTKHTPDLEYPAIRSIYQLYNEQDSVDYAYIEAGHNYNRATREAAYQFLWRHLGGRSGAAPKETVEFRLKPSALLIGRDMKQLTEGKGRAQVFEAWRQRIQAARTRLSQNQRRELLRASLSLNWPEEVHAVPFEEAYVLDYGAGERVPARWEQAGVAKTLLVHEKGAEAALETDAAGEARARGDSVLLIDVFSRPIFSRKNRLAIPLPLDRGDYLSFHRSDDANRIQDVMTALAFLAHGGAPVTLACPGRAAVWCAVAVVAAPPDVTLKLSPDLLEFSQAELGDLSGFASGGGRELLAALSRATGTGAPSRSSATTPLR